MTVLAQRLPNYRAAIAANPSLVKAHCNLGVILANCGDDAGAARSFVTALKIDPSHAQAKAGLQLALEGL